MEVQRELEVGPNIPNIVARVGIENILNPKHPHDPNVRLQVALDEKGQLVTFEPRLGRGGRQDGWRKYRPLKQKRQVLLLMLDDNGQLDHFEGPGTCRFVRFIG